MTPLIGAVQGTIVIDQYDLEKAQLDDRALNLVRSWFDRIQIRLMIKKNQHKRTRNFTACNMLQLYQVTKKAKLIYLLEDKFKDEPMKRIVVPSLHRYQALLTLQSTAYYATS